MKKDLAIKLSRLKRLENTKADLEQYETDSELAAGIIWDAYLAEDVKGKVIADLGCGAGILGIGALLLGAKKVYFVDKDKEAIEIVKENIKSLNLKGEFFCCDITKFNKKVDVVIENPPFGVQKKKADKDFLLKAFEIADKVYSFHKIESRGFVGTLAKENNFKIIGLKEIKFSIKRIMKFHKKKEYNVNVGVWVLERE